MAGFRPEHVRLGSGPEGCFEFDATVEVVEYLGDERLGHLRLGELPLVAKLPVEERLERGTTARFAVPRAAVRFFDAETGVAVNSTP
jgi:ABC-type sugar transport system ATPase subunit